MRGAMHMYNHETDTRQAESLSLHWLNNAGERTESCGAAGQAKGAP